MVILSSITDWFGSAAEGMAEAVSNACATVVSYLLSSVLGVFTTFLDFLPVMNWPFEASDVQLAVAPVMAWNQYIPLVEGFYVLGTFLVFSLVFSIVKIVIKLIPTIG